MDTNNSLMERVERIENHHKFMKEKMIDVDTKISTIYSAILGNELGSEGLVSRFSKIQETMQNNMKDIEALKKSEIITNVYIKQIAWVVGIVGGIVISYVLGFKILGI
mgnify:FL=1